MVTRKGAGSVVRNMLSRKQQRTVEDILAARWSAIEDERPEKEAVADSLTEALGFKVTECNVNAARKILGKRWPQAKAKTRTQTMTTAISDKAHRHKSLTWKDEMLAHAVYNIACELDMSEVLHPTLIRMAKRFED